MLASFAELKQHALAALPVQRCAVAGAADHHALEAVFAAAAEGYVAPVLIGAADQIRSLVDELGSDRPYELVDCGPQANPAQVAVDLVRAGEADFILKGRLQTPDLLRPILNKATGLNDSGFITHFGLMQLAGYHKLLAMSDAAVIPHPSLADKARIVAVGVSTLRRLGTPRPVVAALCASEMVSEKMPETLDAQALADRSANGEFGDAIVLGPISYDLATSAESAAIKGYHSPYAGDVDMLLVPQLVTGNVMSKIWNADGRNVLAGCLVGARVPVGLTSRSASMAEKLNSLLLCSVLSAAGATSIQES
ncbi:MAG: hypothetical protein KIT69_01245 [Propionibacteriaceae bacterium]|nr:hypothetical protein [Propionibacteriaceae bacterium]